MTAARESPSVSCADAAVSTASRASGCDICSWIFLRLLGGVYLIAFASFGVQAMGLIGSRGILPVADFLAGARTYIGSAAWREIPTLFWLNSSDGAIRAVWILGMCLAAVQLFGGNWRAVRIGLFVLYLSLTSAGQDFMGYQWDGLLLESGFLAIFLGSSMTVVWLFRWLTFRLMFMSGAVKLLSHDASWRAFSALPVHYQTQPLPTPVAWYFYRLPEWFQRASVGFVFFVELLVPILVFAPRWIRSRAAFLIVLLQLLIAVTGNYAFFNLLTVALCVLLLDDTWLTRTLPPKSMAWLMRMCSRPPRWPGVRQVEAFLTIFILWTSCFQMARAFFGFHWTPSDAVLRFVAPFSVVNGYGLFAVMTTTRPEIIVEGSNDGEHWSAYDFRYKPEDLRRAPPWVAPHQPRLDWQMWFAALGDYQSEPWIVHFLARLLEGSPDVLGLLRENPFPNGPPRFVRAQMYEYRFSTPEERRATGDWWQRDFKGEYIPALSLRAPQ